MGPWGPLARGVLTSGPQAVLERPATVVWGMGKGRHLQIHSHGLRQERVLPRLIEVVQPQQDAVQVCLGLPLVAFENRRWQ